MNQHCLQLYCRCCALLLSLVSCLQDDPEPATASKGITKTAAQTAAPHSNPSQSHGAGQQAAPLATRQRRSRLAQVTSSSDAPPPLTTAQAAAGGKALQGKSSKKTAKAGQNSPAVGEEDVEPSPQNALCDGNNVSGEEGPEAGQGKTDRASRSIEELAVRFSQATKELQVRRECSVSVLLENRAGFTCVSCDLAVAFFGSRAICILFCLKQHTCARSNDMACRSVLECVSHHVSQVTPMTARCFL